jgi:hypothetical protein
MALNVLLAGQAKLYTYLFTGVDVMITIFYFFPNFRRKKGGFFLKNDVIINFCYLNSSYLCQISNFFLQFFGENIFKS